MSVRGPFHTLDPALEDSRGRGWVPLYAEDCGEGGTKRFWTGDYGPFFERYEPLKPRHFYELLREDVPCHLHLDLEHERPEGFELSDDAVVSRVKDEVVGALLLSEFASEPQEVEVIRINSCSPRKFSYHLIFRVRGAAFQNNYHCGAFMREFPRSAFPRVPK